MKEMTEQEYEEYFSDENLEKVLVKFEELKDLVKEELTYIYLENETPIGVEDSFAPTFLTKICDEITEDTLMDNFYAGLELGMRNTFKVLKEHPELLEKL